MATFTITKTVVPSGGTAVSASDTYTGSSRTTISETVADSQTDQEIVFTLDQSALKCIYILSTQDITMETNNSGAPTDTINLKANVPYIFNADEDSYFTNLITADITTTYWTNASGASATVTIEALTDATP